MNEHLTELKNEVITAKENQASLESDLAERRKPIDEQITALNEQFAIEQAELINTVTEATKNTGDKESTLREKAVEAYEANPETKTLADGISVRVNKGYDFDEKEAVKWAIDHEMPNLLGIKKPAFKKQASITDLDFVTQTENISAVIKY